MKATSTYYVEGRLKIEQNDTIAIIDGRPELSFLKGQNQRNFEIGTFPRNILEVLRFNRNGTLNTISRPAQGSLQDTAHGSAFKMSWGSPYLDSLYSGKVEMRQKSSEHISKSHRQQRTVSENFSKEKKVAANKQFSYNKLVDEKQIYFDKHQGIKNRNKPLRPPAPQVPPQEGVLIDLSPEEICSMNMTLQNRFEKSTPTTTCILDEPIEVPTEEVEFQPNVEHNMPPYPMPPQSLKTNALNDPFDTNHVEPVENFYSNFSIPNKSEPIYNNSSNRYAPSNTSETLNELLSASFAPLSLASECLNENVNGRQLTPKKVNKQMLFEQLLGAKDDIQVKPNLEQLTNMSSLSTTTKGFNPFFPIQTNQTLVSSNSRNIFNNDNDSTSNYYDSNIYNTVANESVYGENFYDSVHSSVMSDSSASAYTHNQQQQAIYDEVTAYDEITWQPQAAALRAAPAPPSTLLLSQQQINRRLEKINQKSSLIVIGELMNKLKCDNMTTDEAKEALQASQWNQELATRHFKIERLSK